MLGVSTRRYRMYMLPTCDTNGSQKPAVIPQTEILIDDLQLQIGIARIYGTAVLGWFFWFSNREGHRQRFSLRYPPPPRKKRRVPISLLHSSGTLYDLIG